MAIKPPVLDKVVEGRSMPGVRRERGRRGGGVKEEGGSRGESVIRLEDSKWPRSTKRRGNGPKSGAKRESAKGIKYWGTRRG